jgi:virginiamycin A acetyltransferase
MANALAAILISPVLCMYCVGRLIVGKQQAFQACSQALSLLPGVFGEYLRRAFYRHALAACSGNCSIGFGTIFASSLTQIHRGVYIGANCVVGAVTLRDDVLISSNVSVLSGAHQHGTRRTDIPIRWQPGAFHSITIGEGSWIGERAVVMADVGEHCVIGAGAVVTKPIPDFSVAVGVPARVTRRREQLSA